MDFGQGTLKRNFVFPVSLNVSSNCFFFPVCLQRVVALGQYLLYVGVSDDLLLTWMSGFVHILCAFLTTPGTGWHTNGKCLLLDSPTQKIPWDVWPLIFYLTNTSLAILLKMFCFVCHMLSTIFNYSALIRIALYSCSVIFIEPEFLAFFFFSFLAEFFIPFMVWVTNFD